MQNNNKAVQSKIAIGYIVLILLSLFSAYYIYTQTTKLSEPDMGDTRSVHKRNLVNNTLALLYEAEGIGQTLSSNRSKDYSRYRNAIKKVQANIDFLKELSSDSVQKQRIDSISLLLKRKERNTVELLKMQQEERPEILYRQNIEKAIARSDTAAQQIRIQQRVVVRQDTVKQKKVSKNFFRRLAEVFVPSKDSDVIVHNTQHLITDTLLETYNQADTLADIFKDIQNEVTGRQEELKQEILRKSDGLMFYNQAITQKINQLLHTFEQEEISHTILKLDNRRNVLKHTARYIIFISVGMLAVALLFLFFILKDIGLSNRYRKQLEKANKQAQDLLQSREKLMLTITHDIKAPVGSIMGYTDLLSRLTSGKRERHYLENMKSSSAHLLDLVNCLLDFHRLESNKMEINPAPFSPEEFFQDIADSFQPLARQKGLMLDYRPEQTLHGKYLGDPFRIRQIAGNLLSNAIKFTRQGTVTFTVVLLKNQDTGELRLVFSVRDTGPGIAPGDQEKIFQEFIRLPEARGAAGFGLGLPITHRLVTLMGGTLTLKSIPGEGSCFEVTLPLMPAPAGEAGKTKENEEEAAPLPPLRCLLIDDDPLQLEYTAALFRQYGLKTICIHKPEEALNYLVQEKPDIVFTDIQMPGLDGFEIVRHIRNHADPEISALPVIALSARSDTGSTAFLDAGFNGNLNKPFSGTELITLIRQIEGTKPHQLPIPEKPSVSENPYPDFAAMLTFAGDDPEAAKEILQSLVSEMEKNRDSWKKGIETQHLPALSALAHKMLPHFRLLKNSPVVSLLSSMEKQTDAFTPETRAHAETILREIDHLIRLACKKMDMQG